MPGRTMCRRDCFAHLGGEGGSRSEPGEGSGLPRRGVLFHPRVARSTSSKRGRLEGRAAADTPDGEATSLSRLASRGTLSPKGRGEGSVWAKRDFFHAA